MKCCNIEQISQIVGFASAIIGALLFWFMVGRHCVCKENETN